MLTPAPGKTVADTIADAARGMDPAEPITLRLAGPTIYSVPEWQP
jgi:hypothetical protein